MSAIKILAETEDTVTIRRADLARLMAELEDAEDRAAVADRRRHEKAVGKELARGSYLTVDEARRLLAGESPVRLWREKRGMTQRALAAAAGIAPSYLTEIEKGRKPGSADAHLRLARVLQVDMDDLMDEQQRRLHPDFGPVFLRLRAHGIGLSEGQRGAAPDERRFATLGEALAEIRDRWATFRSQLPEVSDESCLPILGTEDLVGRMENSPFDAHADLSLLDVSFDDNATWSRNLDSYVMWARVRDGESIRCRIAREVFFDCLDDPQPSLGEFPTLFRRHRITFERAFRNAIRGQFTSDWIDRDTGERRREIVLTPQNFHMLAGR
jgi:transcriptional regulator with XRE-family HTH domain